MMSAYSMSFLFLFLLGGWREPHPVKGFKTLPAEVVGLAYDATRLAPWAADYTSRMKTRPNIQTAGYVVPKASDFSSRIQLVASEPTAEELKRENEELRKRLELIEQMMKDKLSEPPVSGAQTEGQMDPDKKSVPGWTVELHDWNKSGTLSNDPKNTLLTQNCAFTGKFALEHQNQMHLYRFVGTFRARENGRYVFSSDMVCEFDHKCNFNLYVDDQPLIEYAAKTKGQRLVNGLPLTAGDHTLEFRTWLSSNSFLNYRPGQKYKWHVKVKGPSDFNQRDFEPDELFSVIPRKVNLGARACMNE